jgi:hypothetical protein
MNTARTDASLPAERRHARRRELEGYLSAALAALLFATPTLARCVGLSPMTIGIPVFWLMVVFGLRGTRSRGPARVVAFVALTLVVTVMVVSFAVAIIKGQAWMRAHDDWSR